MAIYSWFTYSKWWLSIVMSVYQRVPPTIADMPFLEAIMEAKRINGHLSSMEIQHYTVKTHPKKSVVVGDLVIDTPETYPQTLWVTSEGSCPMICHLMVGLAAQFHWFHHHCLNNGVIIQCFVFFRCFGLLCSCSYNWIPVIAAQTYSICLMLFYSPFIVAESPLAHCLRLNPKIVP